jgi:guanylate kinase
MNQSLAAKIAAYKPSEQTIELINSVPIVLIASMAGGGKDTITKALVKEGGFARIVTNTTRPPRENNGVMEVDGREYHFMSHAQAEQLINHRSFIEVKKVHDNIYGSTAEEFARIKEQGLTAITDVDVQGVDEYLKLKPDTIAIFLLPPSVETWLSRLSQRYGDLEAHSEELAVRYKSAYDEINHVLQDPRYVIVINDDLETTLQRVRAIMEGKVTRESEYAEAVAEHLLEFLKSKI